MVRNVRPTRGLRAPSQPSRRLKPCLIWSSGTAECRRRHRCAAPTRRRRRQRRSDRRDRRRRRSRDAHRSTPTGRVVAPGFVDVHTHYDAQVFWDPTLSPSSLHGVTTVFGGNCGFTIAPLVPPRGRLPDADARPGRGHAARRAAAGVPWNWTTTAEYFDQHRQHAVGERGLHGRPLRAPPRRDGRAQRRRTPRPTTSSTAMSSLLRESLAAGGLGFSSSWAETHNDADGDRCRRGTRRRRAVRALPRDRRARGNVARVHPDHARLHRAAPRRDGADVGRRRSARSTGTS